MAFDPLGITCEDRGATGAGNKTVVNKGNPASADGTIDSCQVFAVSGNPMSSIGYGVVTDNGGNSLTCQSGHFTPEVDMTAPHEVCTTHTAAGNDFTAFQADSGEYIAKYHNLGLIEAVYAGEAGFWYYTGNGLDGDPETQTYTWSANSGASLRATGEEEAAGRTTYNTDAFPLGVNVGISLRM